MTTPLRPPPCCRQRQPGKTPAGIAFVAAGAGSAAATDPAGARHRSAGGASCCRCSPCCKRACRMRTASGWALPTSAPTSTPSSGAHHRQHPLARGADHRAGGDHRLWLRLCPHRTCMPGKPLFRLIGLIPLLMPSCCPPSVWSTGLAIRGSPRAARRREHLRPHRHRHWSGLLVLPHALMILITALGQSDARLYEASGCSAAAAGAPLSPSPCLPPVMACSAPPSPSSPSPSATSGWPGDWRPVQRAGHRHLPTGDRDAELLAGRRCQRHPAAAGALELCAGHRVRSKMQEQSGTKAVPYQPKPHRLRDLLALGWCTLWALLFLALVGWRFTDPGAVLALQPSSDAGSLRL